MRKHSVQNISTIDPVQFAIILEQLAAQAALSNLIQAGGPALPDGWSLLAIINASAPQNVPLQGFLASGPADKSGTQVAVLALGLTWPGYMSKQVDGTIEQGSIPATIGGSAIPASAQFLSVYVSAYNTGRSAVWDSLQYLSNLPLYICGMGIGAPVAQLAALDLRPGNTGPSDQDSPSTSSPCYVFSAANAGNQSFATYYNTLVPTMIFWAGSNLLWVDQFPLSPSDGLNFVPSGTTKNLGSYLPSMDEPWLERSDIYYLSALGGQPAPVTAVAGSVSSPPTGFSQSIAYTLAMLTAAAYQLTQHPGSLVATDPYTLINIIYSQGSPYAYIFQSSDTVVVAIRGCITYLDFDTITCNSNFGTAPFDPNITAHVHAGAIGVYTAPVSGTKGTQFSQALNAALQGVATGKKLYFTGHSLGGTIANLAVADYAISKSPIAVTAVYTFGSIMVGDYPFSLDFNKAVTAGSYQIVRIADKLYNSIQNLGYSSINNQVILNGNLAVDESTFHSLYGYAGLLNPWGPPHDFY